MLSNQTDVCLILTTGNRMGCSARQETEIFRKKSVDWYWSHFKEILQKNYTESFCVCHLSSKICKIRILFEDPDNLMGIFKNRNLSYHVSISYLLKYFQKICYAKTMLYFVFFVFWCWIWCKDVTATWLVNDPAMMTRVWMPIVNLWK